MLFALALMPAPAQGEAHAAACRVPLATRLEWRARMAGQRLKGCTALSTGLARILIRLHCLMCASASRCCSAAQQSDKCLGEWLPRQRPHVPLGVYTCVHMCGAQQ